MEKRTVHFSAPGFKTQLIEVAPYSEEAPSKRNHLIEAEVLYSVFKLLENFNLT